MPPQTNSPESTNLNPGENFQAAPQEVLRTVENQPETVQSQEVAAVEKAKEGIVSEKTPGLNQEVQAVESPVENVTAAQATEINQATPGNLVRQFKVIEGMADDPFAEQEAFKNAQSNYLVSLGEKLDNAA